MGCFRCANWCLHVGGHGVLPLSTGKKIILTENPTCTLSLTLEIPLMLTLEPPSVNTDQFPLKVPSPVDQSSSKMAVMWFLIETALIFNFPQMTR